MRFTKVFILASTVFALLVVAGPRNAGADGKAVFTEKKCNTCHSVKNAGIEKAKKKKGPDLSGVGIEHDAAWIAKWVNKEVEKTSVYSDKKVKHKKKFKGSDAELKEVTTFLAAQKTKVDVKEEAVDDSGDEGGDE